MKKILITILILSTLMITACSTAKSTTNASTQTLSAETELIIGTIKLEGTTQAVTAEQASRLLPLWQLRKELNTNSAAAPQEVEAVIKQIQSTMTTDQIQTIDDMKLTQQDAMTVLQEQGTVQSSKQTSSNTKSQNNSNGFAPPAGGPGGEIPGMGASAITSSTTATKSTQSQSVNNSNAASSSMIDLMIQYLQKKAGA